MNSNILKILLIEDDLGDADLICELLELVDANRFQVTQSRRLHDALLLLAQNFFDVVLLDLSLPDSHGLATVSQVCTQAPTIPIVILSGLEDEAVAIDALHKGAQDYLVKGNVDSNLLVRAIRYALERSKIRLLLNQKEKQLTQANENLERRVTERTAKLKQKNEQLRNLENQLREALVQEKELSEMKSRIITTISHEYRTPLTTISSSAEMLERYRHKWDDEKQLKHFHRIQSSIKHMTDLVNDVLFLNQVEFDKLEFQPTLLNLVSLFREIIDELQSTVTNGCQLTFTSFCDFTQCCLDAKLLRQILTNLLSNAIKYSPDGGTISIELACQGNNIIFSCSDQGIGIPPEDVDKLFESFGRARNVGTIPGTGLGLSIVKKCVELHGGQITLKSEVGIGSKFTVMLPLESKTCMRV